MVCTALCYAAGVMVLSKEQPQVILYRSVGTGVDRQRCRRNAMGLSPTSCFQPGIDRRDDIGSPDRFDVYYGMADNRIGVARLDLPNFLPPVEARCPTCRLPVAN
jgi:predicted GH43/DUF377 family glycosyl hydrolase